MSNTAPQRPTAAVGELNLAGYSFEPLLSNGEELSNSPGPPTVTEETTSDLTITNVAINPSSEVINNKVVPANKAVFFLVQGQLIANSPYTLKITVYTNSTPQQKKIKYAKFNVEGS